MYRGWVVSSLQVISELNGKDINEVVNSGKGPSLKITAEVKMIYTLELANSCVSLFSSTGLSKLASVPAGGAVAAPAAAAAGGGAGAAPAAGTYIFIYLSLKKKI